MINSRFSKLLSALLLCIGALTANSAWAQHGRHIHYGVYVGVPLGWPYYPHPYYPPVYYPQPQVIVQQPPVYIEQGNPQPAPAAAPAPAPAAAASAYWYYCSSPQGYYPYVQQCNVAWQPVAPQPPASPVNTR